MRLLALLIAVLVAAAGCGGDEPAVRPAEGTPDAALVQEEASGAEAEERPADTSESRSGGTVVTTGESEYGQMLFSAEKQAIYIFENDPKGESVCYGECAEAWPPVFTDGRPTAENDVKQSLLGTVKRRDGKLQVTYAGKPLYYYAHEGPNEVRCHNVSLNGGFWWVVGADGKRRP